MEARISTGIGIAIIFIIVIPLGIIGYKSWLELEKASNALAVTVALSGDKKTISAEEKRKIEKWIAEENLNEYGDPKNTVYSGGTPLFNEETGERIDKFQYIVAKHPDRPWNK